MSGNIPFEMQAEIMKRLPIKSLIQFRSVSKLWKSVIDSPKFIKDHTANHNQPHHLLVRYKLYSKRQYISIIDSNNNNDNDSFPQQQFSLTAPRTLSLLRHALVLGSSHGLLCFYGFYKDTDYQTQMCVLWNPSIKKSVGIVIPNVLYNPSGYTVIGFGICPNTSDPKLVKINHIYNSLSESENVSWEVEIFSLSSRVWRRVSIKMPCTPIDLSWGQVVIDGVIYWNACDKLPDDDSEPRYNRIISFNLTSEEFGEVYYSDYLANANKFLVVSKLMGSLVVIEEDCIEDENQVCVVWKMERSVPKSCKKLFSIKAPDDAVYNTILSFRKNGEPVMETIHDYEESRTLQVYEHNTGRFKDLGIYGNGGSVTSCRVISYRETLLLLDNLDSIIH